MHTNPAPEPEQLFPPLLACLPMSQFSNAVPDPLLPLLAPVLRQRVNMLSSPSNKWTSLMAWDPSRASRLSEKVQAMRIEVHPVSGEIEIDKPERIQYRRVDEETLHARMGISEYGLLPIYVWVEKDPQDGTTGWKLHELQVLEDMHDGTQWFDSESAATEASKPSTTSRPTQRVANAYDDDDEEEDGDEDDSYWAAYDQTPGRTPARTPAPRSPAPYTNTTAASATSEEEYYARYNDVQPALDAHDPDEETPDTRDSTLQGATLLGQHASHSPYPKDTQIDSAVASKSGLAQHVHNTTETLAPRPTSPSSASSVERLEQGAADMTRAEMGVKVHIGSEIKNLYRLARSVGVDRNEFERIVRTQLDVLALLEAEEEE